MTAMDINSVQSILRERLREVDERMTSACRRAGRQRAEVTLVAVTKSTTVEVAALLPELGVFDVGENRPQELWHKAAALPSSLRWHMIGHLQRNKIERTLPLVHLVHSVDSLRLLEALEAAAPPTPLQVLLEVNASRESNKHGFAPEQLTALVPKLTELRHVHVKGLMTMAALADDPESSRPTFAEARTLRDGLRQQLAVPHTLEHLSMGMTNDFEIAIEEGATLVRIGSALFGK